MPKWKRRLLIGAAAVGVLALLAVGTLYVLLRLTLTPVTDGAELAGGAVRLVVTGHYGPVPILA